MNKTKFNKQKWNYCSSIMLNIKNIIDEETKTLDNGSVIVDSNVYSSIGVKDFITFFFKSDWFKNKNYNLSYDNTRMCSSWTNFNLMEFSSITKTYEFDLMDNIYDDDDNTKSIGQDHKIMTITNEIMDKVGLMYFNPSKISSTTEFKLGTSKILFNVDSVIRNNMKELPGFYEILAYKNIIDNEKCCIYIVGFDDIILYNKNTNSMLFLELKTTSSNNSKTNSLSLSQLFFKFKHLLQPSLYCILFQLICKSNNIDISSIKFEVGILGLSRSKNKCCLMIMEFNKQTKKEIFHSTRCNYLPIFDHTKLKTSNYCTKCRIKFLTPSNIIHKNVNSFLKYESVCDGCKQKNNLKRKNGNINDKCNKPNCKNLKSKKITIVLDLCDLCSEQYNPNKKTKVK